MPPAPSSPSSRRFPRCWRFAMPRSASTIASWRSSGLPSAPRASRSPSSASTASPVTTCARPSPAAGRLRPRGDRRAPREDLAAGPGRRLRLARLRPARQVQVRDHDHRRLPVDGAAELPPGRDRRTAARRGSAMGRCDRTSAARAIDTRAGCRSTRARSDRSARRRPHRRCRAGDERSAAARTQAMSGLSRQPIVRPLDAPFARSLKLQRKCACGASSQRGEMCDECKDKLHTKLAVGSVDDPARARGRPHRGSHDGVFGPRRRGRRADARAARRRRRRRDDARGAGERRAHAREQRTAAARARRCATTWSGASATTSSTCACTPAATRMHRRATSAHTPTRRARTSSSRLARFRPGTREGRLLLAHELTHVVQQGAAAWPLVQRDAKPASPAAVDKTAQDIIDAAKDTKATADTGQARSMRCGPF